MRNALAVFAILLCVSLLGWTQEDPPSPETHNQPANSAQAQRGRGYWRGRGVAGSITALSDNSLSIQTRDGHDVQVSLSDKTQFSKDRQPAKLTDFKVGDTVFVRGERGDDGVWKAQMLGSFSGGRGGPRGRMREGLGTQFIAGEIKSISGTQLTIARPDGVSQTITVDESTSFRKQQESITLADLKAGDHVFGRGKMKNGVFVPTVLSLGEPRFMRQGGTAPPRP